MSKPIIFRALTLQLIISLFSISFLTLSVSASQIDSIGSSVASALNALNAGSKDSSLITVASKSAKRSGGTALAVRDKGKIIGFDVVTKKSKFCVFYTDLPRRWSVANTNCKSHLFGVQSEAAKAKNKELGQIGMSAMMKALTLSNQESLNLADALLVVISSTQLPADVRYEIIDNVLILTSTLYPKARASIALSR
jgi:hypothetical protein